MADPNRDLLITRPGWRRHTRVGKCWQVVGAIWVPFVPPPPPPGFRLSPETPMALRRPHKGMKMGRRRAVQLGR